MIDFLASLVVGTTPKKIVRPQARRLNCRLPMTVHRYNTRLKQKIRKHRLVEQIGQVHKANLPGEEAKRRLDKIDKEGKNYMINAERKCRKIKSGRIPFSPEAEKWIRRVQVLKSLLKYGHSRKGNQGNLNEQHTEQGLFLPFKFEKKTS